MSCLWIIVHSLDEDVPVTASTQKASATPAASKWDLPRVAIDSIGCCMIVTMLLDFGRLASGGGVASIPFCVPWM